MVSAAGRNRIMSDFTFNWVLHVLGYEIMEWQQCESKVTARSEKRREDGRCVTHQAVSLCWADIYSALHKHFESFLVIVVKEKMNSSGKVCVYVLPLIRYYSMFASTVWQYILDKMFWRWLCGCIRMIFTGFLFSLLSLHICCMARLTIWQLQKLIKAEAGKVIFTFHWQEWSIEKPLRGFLLLYLC